MGDHLNINVISEIENKPIFYPYFNDKSGFSDYPSIINDYIDDKSTYFKEKNSIIRVCDDKNGVFLVNMGEYSDIEYNTVREFGWSCFKRAKQEFIKDFVISIDGFFNGLDSSEVINALCEGINLSDYRYDLFKKKSENPPFEIENVSILTKDISEDYNRIIETAAVITKGVKLTRDMINGPANYITIDYMEKQARRISEESKLDIIVFDHKALAENNMNLILAVGRSGPQKPRMIQIDYKHKDSKKKVVLVGKGIIFDTGGLNIKTEKFMDNMKSDMSGAAIVMSVIDIVAKLKMQVDLTVLMPLAENSIGPESYRPGDIITGHKGKSVEIHSTDAEGRLILADALSYADTLKPDIVIDIATLTGAVRIALGSKMFAGFFRNNEIESDFKKVSDLTGEYLWSLPLFKHYKKNIRSDFADLANLGTPSREAGSIMAALFLGEFIENNNWVHLDIASVSFADNEYCYLPKGGSGIPVRTLVRYIQQI